MTTEQCYASFGGNYAETLSRLGKESLIKRILLKFPADNNFSLLCSSLAEGDTPTAFRAVHTLKGVALNLGLSSLAASSSELTELLRGGSQAGYEPLLEKVRADYDLIIEVLRQID